MPYPPSRLPGYLGTCRGRPQIIRIFKGDSRNFWSSPNHPLRFQGTFRGHPSINHGLWDIPQPKSMDGVVIFWPESLDGIFSGDITHITTLDITLKLRYNYILVLDFYLLIEKTDTNPTHSNWNVKHLSGRWCFGIFIHVYSININRDCILQDKRY